MFLTVFFACMLIGSVVGFLAGLLGIGGGLVIVPALVYLLPKLSISADITMPIALATSLASIVITSSSAAFVHHKNSNIPWPITRKLMLVVAIGALVGAFIADLLSAEALTAIFATCVILLASYMLLSIRKPKKKGTMPSNFFVQLLGLFTGIIASLMGIAGGAVLVPALNYFGMPLRHTIGVATACGMMVALFGSLGYIISGFNQPELPEGSFGYIYLPALLGIVLTSSIFAPVGVKLATQLPIKTLKMFFAAFLIIVAIKMMWSTM